MTSTVRWLNRALLILVGLVLLAAGTAAALGAALPHWRHAWTSTAPRSAGPAEAAVTGPLGSWPHGMWLIIAPMVCAAVITLLLIFILRQGHGATAMLYSHAAGDSDRPSGTLTVDSAVASAALRQALDSHPDIVGSAVGAYRVRHSRMLKLTVTVRRGASPVEVRAFAERALAEWDSAFGETIPALIQINAGVIARAARPTRLASAGPRPETTVPERN